MSNILLRIVLTSSLWAVLTVSAQAQERCAETHLGKTPEITEPIREAMKDLDANEMSLLVKELLQTDAKATIRQIEKLESQLERLRSLNGSYERSAVMQARRRLQLLNTQLGMKEVKPAVDLYRQLFRDVEKSYFFLKKNLAKMNELTTNEARSERENVELRALRKENELWFKKLGQGYGEYRMVRTFLEKSENPLAPVILERLGIRGLGSMFPELGIPRNRASMDAIAKMYREHPEALIAKLKRDRAQEAWLSVKVVTMSPALLSFLKARLASIRGERWQRMTQFFFGFAYDIYVRDLYLDKIERVVNLRGEVEKQFLLLRELNAQSAEKDEMLVTFARLTTRTDMWVELRVKADEMADKSLLYKDFAERMAKAEEAALNSREISLFYEPSPIEMTVRSGLSIYFGYETSNFLLVDVLPPAYEFVRQAVGL